MRRLARTMLGAVVLKAAVPAVSAAFTVRDRVDEATVDDGSLFYTIEQRRRMVVKRIDLARGRRQWSTGRRGHMRSIG